MNDTPMKNQSPSAVQRTCWILWGAMLMGMGVFLAAAIYLNRQRTQPPNAQLAHTFFIVGIAVFFTVVPAGYFIRIQSYKKNWVHDVVTPQGYLTGNLVLWAACEGVAMMGLAFGIATGVLWPTALCSAAAIAVMVMNYPHGSPMYTSGKMLDGREFKK
ncbi:MAG: hypothetical protein GC164_08770 [Phycisphaera sp.]|nr:hypothetical protein [Phycisphaera sp.]